MGPLAKEMEGKQAHAQREEEEGGEATVDVEKGVWGGFGEVRRGWLFFFFLMI